MPVVARSSHQLSIEHHSAAASVPGVDSLALLWDRYRAFADEAAREELLRRHLSLVHFVAGQMAAKTSVVEYDELVSAGALGLLAALDAYDPMRGFAFSTYAVCRIRGAVLDDLRRRDWMPRSSRSRSRQLAAARARIQGAVLRAPCPAEVARELGLDLESYWRWYDELDAPALDAAPTSDRGLEARARGRRLEPDAAECESPEHHLLRDEAKAELRTAITRLPEREQQVLALCYFEELTLKNAGVVLGVAESRVSQLRQHALRHLGGVLQA